MAKLINEYIHNGKITQEFDNGVKIQIYDDNTYIYSENELFKAQIKTDLEYIKCLLELKG